MITAVDRFVLSKSPYTLRPDTFCVEDRTWEHQGVIHPRFAYTVEALWVRRTRGVLGVHCGRLYDSFTTPDLTFEQFRDQHTLARYGGTVLARWDSQTLWTPAPIPRTEEAELLAVLEPAFDHLAPLIEAKAPVTPPAGWDGWYVLTEQRRAA